MNPHTYLETQASKFSIAIGRELVVGVKDFEYIYLLLFAGIGYDRRMMAGKHGI